MRSEKSNKQVRNTIKITTNLVGIKKTLQLPGAVELKQNKNWIDKWMKQNERIKVVKTTPIVFSKTSGLTMNWWEN
jgi:hypothetical protein